MPGACYLLCLLLNFAFIRIVMRNNKKVTVGILKAKIISSEVERINFVYPDTKITGNFKIFPTRVACISSISTNQDFIMSYVLPNVQLMMRRVSRGLRKKILCFFSIRLQLLLDLIRISWTLTINLYSTYHHYNISKPTPLLKCQSLFPSYYPTHFGNGVHFLSLLFIRIGFN